METSVGDYLVARLKQAGLQHVFGVPGDYVLTFMDRLLAGGLDLVGTCNELNAGYAADAYARIKGIGCICVTWGVGGFSAMNAVAGAFAEQVPLVVIIGSPKMHQRRSSMLLHHSVGNFATQMQAYAHITAATVLLDDASEAPKRIDHALARCLNEKRPVMIEIPVDMVSQPCPLPGPFMVPGRPPSEPDALAEGLDETVALLASAKRAVILGGAELHRYGLMSEFHHLVQAAQLPVATTLLGKTVLSEKNPLAVGVYEGAMARPEVRSIVESADVLLCLGAWLSDISLGVHTGKLAGRNLILANSGRLKVSQHVYESVWIGDVLTGLTTRTPPGGFSHPPFSGMARHIDSGFTAKPAAPLTLARALKRISACIGEDTTVIAEAGDALFAAADLVMHHDVGFIGQAFYLSIGYALPATLGATLADPVRRPIALIGDGAFQMSAQELSSLIRRRSNAIVIVLNNGGYTTERVIHEGPYNDIQPWEFHRLPEVFGGSPGRRVHTEDELDDALNAAVASNTGPSVIEIMLERMDTSEALKRLGAELNPNKKPQAS